MKRICIYALYDKFNDMPDYIIDVLNPLRELADFLVVVRNVDGRKPVIENDIVSKIADKIYLRDNIGFDSGAFKDVIIDYLGWDIIQEYDELLLVNDSFFGFIYPLCNFLDEATSNNCDYYGMTRYPGGITIDGINLKSHVESFFMGFKKKVINSECFRHFWDEMEYANNYTDAVLNYEIKLNYILNNNGFLSWTPMDDKDCSWLEYNEVPYLLYSFELITECKIPIIKRKCFELSNKGYKNAIDAYDFAKTNGLMDTEKIREYLLNYNEDKIGEIGIKNLEVFCRNHNRVYVYGAGTYGQNVELLIERLGYKHSGFIVTDNDYNKEYQKITDITIEDNDGIIIAVYDKESIANIYEIVRKYIDNINIIVPN